MKYIVCSINIIYYSIYLSPVRQSYFLNFYRPSLIWASLNLFNLFILNNEYQLFLNQRNVNFWMKLFKLQAFKFQKLIFMNTVWRQKNRMVNVYSYGQWTWWGERPFCHQVKNHSQGDHLSWNQKILVKKPGMYIYIF